MPEKLTTTKQKTKLSVENFSTMTLAEQSEFIKQAFYEFKVCLIGNYATKT